MTTVITRRRQKNSACPRLATCAAYNSPSTTRSVVVVGRVFLVLVLTGACQFGHGVGGFTTNSIHSLGMQLKSTRRS